MSMLDSLFKKGFNGAKCKTLLKLTIPRIKLLRNRREIQLRQMRRDIAKLLETGQEATARIRVEHIVREENMMAAQEIMELFCELIAVRLPIIEIQRECPLDLKEAISSICFAAPRCSDLPELQQVQMLFGAKYGKEFVAAATELMPDCGVNRQVIELLSVRAPSAEAKLKLLKEIAEEHDLDWDPAASETELTKAHEDLLHGPSQFISGSKLPLPKEKHNGSLPSTPVQVPSGQSDSDPSLDSLDLPEVPKVSLRPGPTAESTPEMAPFHPPSADLVSDNDIEKYTRQPGPATVSAPEMVSFHSASAVLGSDNKAAKSTQAEDISNEYCWEPDTTLPEQSVTSPSPAEASTWTRENKQFLPFVSAPSFSSTSFCERTEPAQPHSLLRTKSEVNVDLQDVLAAAQAAAETAELAAKAARSAASLAEVRITEFITKREVVSEDSKSTSPTDGLDKPSVEKTPTFNGQQSFTGTVAASHSSDSLPGQGSGHAYGSPNTPSDDTPRKEPDPQEQVLGDQVTHQPRRLPSLEDDPYFSYPNLFSSPDSNLRPGIHSPTDNLRSEHGSEQ